ncbi:succinate dehydrogenase, hydrophobic membrane anchor protein [Crenalkalicoccus roseus]|uniref:succinate dehydrogenase, hydrophobic membrane anchor protein n=1 Tax=Crenalkalicoccus roseus TaxID=1485588 RepID=UPI00107FDEAF|nr:succinate dehydrogenase, hydrophobic membrane anchor protein [Crenalkalicoccus roseus]
MAEDQVRTTTLRTPLGRVRGLGSAKSGVRHWWVQRVTSAALLPLTLWFVISAALLAGATHAETVAWIARPWNAVLLLLTIGLSFYHTALGAQVIFEDYINQEWLRMAYILGVKALCWLLGLAAALAVLRIAV